MCWICKVFVSLFRALFFLFWDGLKAITSPFRRKRTEINYGDEICLVTGAAQGLGRMLALEFARRNAVMVIWDIQEQKLEEVANEMRETGTKVYAYVCDCCNREDIKKVAAKVKREVGPVSILVNNAGIMSKDTIMESNEEDIERTFQLNTLAHFWTVKAFLPWMLENNYGYIVQISSILAYGGVPQLSSYSASKAAALSFAETLREELRVQKKTGVSVTCVCPFHIDTSMFVGVTVAFPSLFPTLKAGEVAERILQAVKERQFIVAIPKSMYLLMFFKSFVPTRTMDAIVDLLGVPKAMESLQTKKD